MSGFVGLMATHKTVVASGSPYVTTGLVLNFDAGNSASYPGSGTTWTDTASSKVATLNSGATYSSSNGGVIVFNGTNNVPITGFTSLANNFTLECWYQANQVSSKYQPALYQTGTIGSLGFMMGYYASASPANSWKATKYGVVDIYIGTIPQNTNWHQVTYTYSSTAGVAVYVDGSSVGSYANTGNLSTSTTNKIGFGESGNHNGSIGSIRMWNSVLSSAQVLQNYNGVKSKYGL